MKTHILLAVWFLFAARFRRNPLLMSAERMQYTPLQEETCMPRLKGSGDLLEDRRRRALALWDTGLSLNEVGRRIRCAPSSVMR
jgi:hypothetical protein